MAKIRKKKTIGGSKKTIESAIKNKSLDLSSFNKGKVLSKKIKSKINDELNSNPINCSKLYSMKDMADDHLNHDNVEINKLKSDLREKYDLSLFKSR